MHEGVASVCAVFWVYLAGGHLLGGGGCVGCDVLSKPLATNQLLSI